MKTLSICIPTYNREVQLKELITSLLDVRSNDFEVVVTNNCSTDNTLSMLNKIKDERLVVLTNDSPEPALYNMIVSIFNAKGRYALYCNDRDVIFTERLLPFIDFLKSHDYSYLHIAKCYGNPSYHLEEYDKGYDSLIHHSYTGHPTGMVFNVELMNKYLHREDYKKYLVDSYTYCFLQRDLVKYEKSAMYDNYLWDERPSIFKVKSVSGSVYKGQLFFESEKTIDFMRSVTKHLIGNPYFSLSPDQEKVLILDVFSSFKKRLMGEKRYFADNRECMHYGIKRKFISYFKMKDNYVKYFEACDATLRETPYYDELKDKWNEMKRAFFDTLLKDCIRCDKTTISIAIRRALDPQSRY